MKKSFKNHNTNNLQFILYIFNKLLKIRLIKLYLTYFLSIILIRNLIKNCSIKTPTCSIKN